MATAEQAVFDLVADGLGPEVTWATTRPSGGGAGSSSTRGRPPSTAGTAEIQRNIIARRLLDLGQRPVMDGDGPGAVRAQTSATPSRRHDRRGPRPRPRRARLARRPGGRPPHGRRPACSSRRSVQGRHSSALDRVRRPPPSGSDRRRPRASCCPPLGRRPHPVGVRRATARGAAAWPPAALDRTAHGPAWWSTTRRRPGDALEVPTADLTLRPVRGVDPEPGPGGGARRPCQDGTAAHRRVGRGVAGGRRPGPAGRWGTSWSARPGPCSSWPGGHALERVQFGRPIADVPGRPPPAGRRPWWPSRRPTPSSASAWEDGSPPTAAVGQGAGRPGRRDDGPPLPAGAGRHRLHHRARLPPLRPARPGARPAVRDVPRPHPGARAASCSPPGGSPRCRPCEPRPAGGLEVGVARRGQQARGSAPTRR